jgi:hypothetical protein
MSARTDFRLSLHRGSPGPAILALPGRVDRVELVELASGETVLYWEGKPEEARRLTRAIRRDLAKLETDAFRSTWLVDEPSATTE